MAFSPVTFRVRGFDCDENGKIAQSCGNGLALADLERKGVPMIRLVPNQADLITRSAQVAFTFDGQAVTGFEGESLTAALNRAGIFHLRDAPNGAPPRGAFCCMGMCQECVVRIQGRIVEACRVLVATGLEVERAS